MDQRREAHRPARLHFAAAQCAAEDEVARRVKHVALLRRHRGELTVLVDTPAQAAIILPRPAIPADAYSCNMPILNLVRYYVGRPTHVQLYYVRTSMSSMLIPWDLQPA
jgi:hypothetical protein